MSADRSAAGARAPGRADVEAAAARIAPHVRTTPVLGVELDGATVELKLECLQVSGTFKARGAFARLTAAPEGPRRVVAASGGNHGIAVAYAARRLGWRADVFVPRTSPAAKVERLSALGATVHADGDEYAHAYAASRAFAAAEGALESHAYDQFDTLAGQGTLAREWLAQTAGTDVWLVAVGGGGLIGGIAAWLEALAGDGAPVPRLVAVESEGCPTLHAALAAGRIVEVAPSGLAADSLGARRVGELMFPLARTRIAESVLVPDAAIAAAQARLWRETRIAAEPGGAAAFAALASGAWRPAAGERVGVLVCGANVDPRAIAGALDASP
ncbi:MAG TPA: serine/threonine dehydratase [Burkholderiaceae bacterium]|nr:serine/threonine dehydratase [Burkholderiaceae bacterium]